MTAVIGNFAWEQDSSLNVSGRDRGAVTPELGWVCPMLS
jgi:hypothetical protein